MPDWGDRCKCDGENVVVRRKLTNGQLRFGKQCSVCGKWQAIKASTVGCQEVAEFDESIAEKYRDRRKAIADSEYSDKQEKDRVRYEAYLSSSEWHDKRQRVLIRDENTCQACLRRPAEQVHHLTYFRIFNEPLFDLVAVCRTCHEALHDGRT